MHAKAEPTASHGGERDLRTLSGPAKVGGERGYWFDVYVEDNGEPCRKRMREHPDTFPRPSAAPPHGRSTPSL